MCASCTCDVKLLLTTILKSEIFFNSPPVFPNKEIMQIFFFLAYSAALTIDIEVPLALSPPPVEIKKSKSFFF